MQEPRIGHHVITEHGAGIVHTIAAGHADTDIVRYRITTGTVRRWHYLDELIVVADHDHAHADTP